MVAAPTLAASTVLSLGFLRLPFIYSIYLQYCQFTFTNGTYTSSLSGTCNTNLQPPPTQKGRRNTFLPRKTNSLSGEKQEKKGGEGVAPPFPLVPSSFPSLSRFGSRKEMGKRGERRKAARMVVSPAL